ncbi:hypothetical protein FB446DRAFT_744585 [Lentinula raphanica]|nr:hypothetical protein FB446DRAFT_744585 [Lentinula raphanica]
MKIHYLQQPYVLQLCMLCCVQLTEDDMFELSLEKLAFLCLNAPVWKETILWMRSLSNWFDNHKQAQWMKPYTVEGPEEDHAALAQSFVEHELGEPWILSIFMAMMNQTAPWYENDMSFGLQATVRALCHTLQVSDREEFAIEVQPFNDAGEQNDTSISTTPRNTGWVSFQQTMHISKLWPWAHSRKPGYNYDV